MRRHHTLLLLLLGVLAAIAPRLLQAVEYDRNWAVRSLAVLGSPAAPNGTCLSVLVSANALVAPAHCVAHTQLKGEPIEWAVFGFSMLPLEADDTINVWPVRGVFSERVRVRVTQITLHPAFDLQAPSAQQSGFYDHDWAVVHLAHAPVERSDNRTIEPLPFLDDAVSEVGNSPYFGAVFVARDSLDLTWVDNPRVAPTIAACGLPLLPMSSSTPLPPLDPLDAGFTSDLSSDIAAPFNGPNNVVCLAPADANAPPFPIANNNNNNSSSSATNSSTNSAWLGALLLFEHIADVGYFVAGFSTSHTTRDTANTQSFTWAEAIGPDFFGPPLLDATARWKWALPDDGGLTGAEVPDVTKALEFITGVRVRRKSSNFCGGSLIAPTFVLTAAHCIDALTDELWVSIGSLMTAGNRNGEQIRVARVVVHPAFDAAAKSNDLALLELAYASVATPIALFNDAPLKPTIGRIFGYGALKTDGTPSDVLRAVDVRVIASNKQCSLDLQADVDTTAFCAGGQANEDACNGDSGGPLVVHIEGDSDATALLGVISYGRGCGGASLPGVYANVSSGYAFIASVVGAHSSVQWTSLPPLSETPVDNSFAGRLPKPQPTPSTELPTSPAELSTPVPASSAPSSPSSLPLATEAHGSLAPASTGSLTPQSPATVSAVTATTKPGGTNAFVLRPSQLQPSTKRALVAFLVGDSPQVQTATATALFTRSDAITFVSTASLASLEQIVEAYSRRPLQQRDVRFAESRSSVAQGVC